MELAAVKVGSKSDGDEFEVDKNRNVLGYNVIFTRNINGVPFTYQRIDQVGLDDKEQYDEGWEYERAYIFVDDSGVTGAGLNGNMEITGISNENVELLPFDQIIKIFNEQLFIRNRFYKPENKNVQSPIKSIANIDRITLGYTRVKVKDKPGEGQLIPVWDFFGSTQNEYDLDAIEKDLNKNIGDKDVVKECMENFKEIQNQKISNGYESFLTINAIDGSVIDRNLGY